MEEPIIRKAIQNSVLHRYELLFELDMLAGICLSAITESINKVFSFESNEKEDLFVKINLVREKIDKLDDIILENLT